MTTSRTPKYAAYNGQFYIWACYASDKDCCTSYIPSTFNNPKYAQQLIDRNAPNGFKVERVT